MQKLPGIPGWRLVKVSPWLSARRDGERDSESSRLSALVVGDEAFSYRWREQAVALLTTTCLLANRFAGYALLNLIDDPAMLAIAFC